MGDLQHWEGQDSQGAWVRSVDDTVICATDCMHCAFLSKEIVACVWHPKGQVFASADRNKKVILWKR